MTFSELRRLAVQLGQKVQMPVTIEQRTWPFEGSVQKIGNHLFIWIDARLNDYERLECLAHEVGHLAFGHYQLADEYGVGETWYQHDGHGNDEWEQEADYFACFALRSSNLPIEWWIGRDQYELF